MVLRYKQGDTHNAIKSTLIKNGLPIDLTGCDVFISVSDKIHEERCMVVDENGGVVAFPVATITRESGYYSYEFLIKYSDGTQELVPNKLYKKMQITKNIKE